MIIKTLFILNSFKLYEILNEISSIFNFELKHIEKQDFEKIDFKNYDNYLVLSSHSINNKFNSIIIKNFPYKLNILKEKINLNFLKNQFNIQSKFKIGKYSIDINAKKIKYNNISLSITERECKLILFINKSKKASLENIQKKVWGHLSKLETHTVETHIYRLKQKLNEIEPNLSFLLSSYNGLYSINFKN